MAYGIFPHVHLTGNGAAFVIAIILSDKFSKTLQSATASGKSMAKYGE